MPLGTPRYHTFVMDALCTVSELWISGMFASLAVCARGYYRINCRWAGEDHLVVIDDLIPCIDDQPAFGRLGAVR